MPWHDDVINKIMLMRVLSPLLLHLPSKYLSASSQNGVSSSGAPVRKEGVLMQDGERLYISYGKKVCTNLRVCLIERVPHACNLHLCFYACIFPLKGVQVCKYTGVCVCVTSECVYVVCIFLECCIVSMCHVQFYIFVVCV